MRSDAFTKAAPGRLEPIPEGVEAFVPDPLPPLQSAFTCLDCLSTVEMAAVSLGGLKTLVEAVPNTDFLVESFLRREAIRSSHIEGTKTELGELLLFELGAAESTDIDDAEQVHRNLSAIHFGIEASNSRPVYSGLLRDTHRELFANTNRVVNRPGEYRASSARIGGRPLPTAKEQFADAKFVPAPAKYIAQAMEDLDQFINNGKSQLPVLVQLALMHYQFETIHPFADGNGRIGRLAISLLLKVRNVLPRPILCLSAFMDEHREEYTDRMLAVSQKGEWREWVNFFLEAVRSQADDDSARCRRLLDLYDQYLEVCSAQKLELDIIKSLFRFPATTRPRIAQVAPLAPATAGKRAEALEEAGILIEVTGKSTNRIYLAQDIIDVLEKRQSDETVA